MSPTSEGATPDVYVEIYSRFSRNRKRSITAICALCGCLAPISTTSLFAAIPEIVETYETTAIAINISNALYLICMGLASCLWGPWADLFGRRSVGFVPDLVYMKKK